MVSAVIGGLTSAGLRYAPAMRATVAARLRLT